MVNFWTAIEGLWPKKREKSSLLQKRDFQFYDEIAEGKRLWTLLIDNILENSNS